MRRCNFQIRVNVGSGKWEKYDKTGYFLTWAHIGNLEEGVDCYAVCQDMEGKVFCVYELTTIVFLDDCDEETLLIESGNGEKFTITSGRSDIRNQPGVAPVADGGIDISTSLLADLDDTTLVIRCCECEAYKDGTCLMDCEETNPASYHIADFAPSATIPTTCDSLKHKYPVTAKYFQILDEIAEGAGKREMDDDLLSFCNYVDASLRSVVLEQEVKDRERQNMVPVQSKEE